MKDNTDKYMEVNEKVVYESPRTIVQEMILASLLASSPDFNSPYEDGENW